MKIKIKLNFITILIIIFVIINLCLSIILLKDRTNPNLCFYISTTGSDSNVGSNRKPFKTLEGCQRAIGNLLKEDKIDSNTINIYLREGIYYLNKSFVLDKNDYINDNISVTYKAYKNDKVTITGAVELDSSKFKKITDETLLSSFNDKDAAKHIFQYDLKKDGIHFGNTFEDITKSPELFFNDTPMTLSRWPNDGFLKVDKVIYNPQKNEKKGFIFQTNNSHITMLKNLKDIWMFGYWYHDWSDSTLKVKVIKEPDYTIESETNASYGIKENQRYYFLNILQELDTLGEYYINREKGILYFYPPSSIATSKIQLSQLNDCFIKVSDLSNITFQNITFESSRSSGIAISNCYNIKVDKCVFRNLSQNAVTIKDGKNCGVENCTIYNTGTGGVTLSGGDRNTLTPANHYCCNNRIYNFARIKRTYSAAVNISGVGNRVANNSIHDSPHTAILFSGNDHVIEYNEIYNVATETDDVGAIYTGRDWTYRGNIIRYNFLHHINDALGNCGKGGIYLDDCMSSAEVYGNIFYKVDKPLFIGGGRDITISNNIIVDCNKSICFDERGITWMKLDILYDRLNNIQYNNTIWKKKYPELMELAKENNSGIPKGNVIENNVLYKTTETTIAKSVIQFGTIKDNILFNDNPGFKDIDKMDFTLKRDSKVYKMLNGFKDIPIN